MGSAEHGGCLRAWAFRYIAKLRTPEVPWAGVAHYVADRKKDARNVRWWRDPKSKIPAPASLFEPWTPGMPVMQKVRSGALGKAVHDRLEGWYLGQAVRWDDFAGQVALSGTYLLPHPSKCHDGGTETYIGHTPYARKFEHDPPVVRVVNGVTWSGKRDLVVSAPGEFLRLGINAPDGWALCDYKSSADIGRYALTADELHTDFQANLYTYDTCDTLKIQELPCHWVYFGTKTEKRHAEARDTTITLDEAARVVERASDDVRQWDTIQNVNDAPCNTDVCGEYGGCMYHKSAGGPCDAQRSIAALISLRVPKAKKETTHMAIPNSGRFAALKDGVTTPPPPDAAAQAPAAAAAQAPATEPAPAEAKRSRGRPKGSGKAAEQAASAPTEAPAQAAQLTGHVQHNTPVALGGALGDDLERKAVIPGRFAPVVIAGDARDVLEAVTRLMGL